MQSRKYTTYNFECYIKLKDLTLTIKVSYLRKNAKSDHFKNERAHGLSVIAQLLPVKLTTVYCTKECSMLRHATLIQNFRGYVYCVNRVQCSHGKQQQNKTRQSQMVDFA